MGKIISQIKHLQDIHKISDQTANYSIKLINDCTATETKKIRYCGHLADSRDLVQDITSKIENRQGGLRVHLFAPCGAGKTYFCLSTLPGLLKDSIVILCVPNAIQAEQNASYGFMVDNKYISTVSITGKSGNDFQLRPGTVYSSVYDCVYRLNDIIAHTDEDVRKNIILIIDEAHQLFDARNYRAKAINNLLSAAQAVYRYGGVVMSLTGTPTKILGMKADVEYRCEEVDQNGEVIPAQAFKSLEVRHKANKNINFYSFMYDTLNHIIEAGGIPFARINSKHDIEQLSLEFKAMGREVMIIDSDTKGYVIDVDPATGEHFRKYDSPAFEKIQEQATLPYADLYLCTSMLEVGTSIKYIEDVAGQKTQPRNLVPVYFAKNPNNFDLDAMEQFASRPRFAVDKFILAMNDTSRPSKDGIMTYAECIVNQVTSDIKKLGVDIHVFDTIATGSRKTEDDDMIYNEAGIATSIDTFNLFATAWVAFGDQVYKNPTCVEQVMNQLFPNIPVTSVKVTEMKKMEAKSYTVPQEVKDILTKAVEDKSFVEAVTRKGGLDRTQPDVAKLAADPEGKKVLVAVRRYSRCGAFDVKQAAKIAVSRLEHPRDEIKLDQDTTVLNPDKAILNKAYKEISEMKDRKLSAVTTYISGYNNKFDGDRRVDLAMNLTDSEMDYVDQVLAEGNAVSLGKAVSSFVKYYTVAKTRQFFATLSEGQDNRFADYMNMLITINDFNTFLREQWNRPDFLKRYGKKVEFGVSLFHAEYHALIRNEQFMRGFKDGLVSKDGTKVLHGWYYADAATDDAKPKKPRWHFQNGFIGHKIKYHDLEMIAEQMPHAVNALQGNQRAVRYEAADILRLLRMIYTVSVVKDSKGGDIYRVTGIRKTLPHKLEWTNCTESEAVCTVEKIVTDCEAGMSATAQIVPEKQIAKILRKYTAMNGKQSAQSLKNLADYCVSCMENINVIDRQKYELGFVKKFVDAEKKRLSYMRSGMFAMPLEVEDMKVITEHGLALDSRKDWVTLDAIKARRHETPTVVPFGELDGDDLNTMPIEDVVSRIEAGEYILSAPDKNGFQTILKKVG